MKNICKKVDHKSEKRIDKVLDFLGNAYEGYESESEVKYNPATDGTEGCLCSEAASEGELGYDNQDEKSRTGRKQICKTEHPNLGNDVYRWHFHDVMRRYYNRKQKTYRPNNIFNRMNNEFLLLFKANKEYEFNTKKGNTNQQAKVVRNKYPNEYTIDPLIIKEDLKIMRETPEERLNHFERMRGKGKFRKLTERERQIIIRHIRTEKIKKEFLRKMEWYFLAKLAEQRIRIHETEKLKYEKKVEIFLAEIPELEKEKLHQLDETLKKTLAEERERAELMKKALIGEEILTTADSTETEIKDKYEQFIMKLKLSELEESYQLDMDTYYKFWKRKAMLMQIEMDEEKQATKREIELCEMQRKLECLSDLEKFWKREASNSLKASMKKVRKIGALIPPKERELKRLTDENEELETHIGHWKKILPEYIKEEQKFIQFSFKDSPEKEALLKSIEQLKEFVETTPKLTEQAYLEETSSSKESLIHENEMREDQQKAEIVKEQDYDMALAHLYLSDGDFEETAKKLLQVKYIILELIKHVLPSEESLLKGKGKPEFKEASAISDDSCQVCSSSDETTSRKLQFMSTSVSQKFEDILNTIDKTFKVVGLNFSNTDFTTPKEFIGKRIISINTILNK